MFLSLSRIAQACFLLVLLSFFFFSFGALKRNYHLEWLLHAASQKRGKFSKKISLCTSTHSPISRDDSVADFSVSFQRKGSLLWGAGDMSPGQGQWKDKPSKRHWWLKHYTLKAVLERLLAPLSSDHQEEGLDITSSNIKTPFFFWQTMSSICLAHIQIPI